MPARKSLTHKSERARDRSPTPSPSSAEDSDHAWSGEGEEETGPQVARVPRGSTQPPPTRERPSPMARREPSPLFRILRSLFDLCAAEAKKNRRMRNGIKKTARRIKNIQAQLNEHFHVDVPPSPPGFEAEPDEPEEEEIEDPFAGIPSDYDFFGFGHGYGYPPLEDPPQAPFA
ncbi:Os07g0470900 [Oryza sativa Japonica Group]|uniref:Os07g0470900 protein n=1 Tax=Oryza sativa subsp. japonica TaxID=39947 RepID=Q0D6K4_ORYSJ|nr:Os07g0470900 [Oryza sativa Japonica Group]|eukprot:NP_001059605.1 Os07g0470900 [Oryza sativa Japonica Group]